ncbi:solute carrier family 23 protein [Staphylococcus aureus]
MLITKAQIPAYFEISLWVTPIITGLITHSLGTCCSIIHEWCYVVIIGILIKLSGTAWLMKLLPPVVVGPVIMVIGLSLAPTAVNMAMYENPGDMKGYNIDFFNCCNDNLLLTIVVQGFFKGFLSLIPVFIVGIIVGYVVAIFMGIVRI